MKRVFISLLLVIAVFTPTPAASQQCLVDMSGAVASFGFDGTTNTLFISNISAFAFAFTVNWKLNLQNGNWDLEDIGGAASGTGGLVDFSSAEVTFSGCVDMVISNLIFEGQSYTLRWSVNQNNGNWDLVGL